MILSTYERKDSPWVWIQYRFSPKGKKKCCRTRVRKEDPEKAHKVKVAMNQLEAEMLRGGMDGEGTGTGAHGDWAWVPAYLQTRYGARAGSLRLYLLHWRALTPFLVQFGIRSPALLTREHCTEQYVSWRTAQVKQKSGRSPGINVAIDELKLLGLLMDEAVCRGFAESNPARSLKIARAESATKPEISDEEAALIYRALEEEPVWMQRSFHVALQTGLRFSETQILRRQIRWQDGDVLIENPKGGRKREFAIPIYPEIEELLRAFWAEGTPALWEVPAKSRSLTGLAWTKFFRRMGLPHLCFHSTRVSFITRGARAGVPESAMMAMVNHASKEVHRIYQRFRGVDALRFRAMIATPVPPAPGAKG